MGVLMPRQREGIREKDVQESDFVIELEFGVPEGFWEKEEEPEPPYHDPAQRYFWKRAIPKEPIWEDWRDEWLESFHDELMKKGWPKSGLEANYSYIDGELDNPDEGEEREEDIPPAMRFYLWVPGEWLIENRGFLKSVDQLQGKPLKVKVRGKKVASFLNYYRISGDRGPLSGADWESGYFEIRPPRERPSAFEGGPRDWFPEEPE